VSGGVGSDVDDLLTCGECQEEFPLADIVRFIRHKVSHGNERCVTSSPPVDDEDHQPTSRVLDAPRDGDAAATAAGQCSRMFFINSLSLSLSLSQCFSQFKLEYLAVYGRASMGECAPRKCGPKFTKI